MRPPAAGVRSWLRPLVAAVAAAMVYLPCAGGAWAQGAVEPLVQQLLEGEAREVAAARESLTAMIAEGDAGRNAQITRLLEPAAASDRVLTRLNTMILAGELAAQGLPASLTLAEGSKRAGTGLHDTSAGVRYWAAKAVSRYLQDRQPQRGAALLSDLLAIVSVEPSPEVAREVMRAMGAVDQPDRAERLIEGLNARVQLHAATAEAEPFAAATLGLTLAQDRLIERIGGGGNEVVTAALGELGIAATRLMRVALSDLQAGPLDAAMVADHAALLKAADQRLRLVYTDRRSAGPQPQPADPGDAIDAADWEAVLQTAEQWQSVLQAAPFNVPAERFEVGATAEE